MMVGHVAEMEEVTSYFGGKVLGKFTWKIEETGE
jgi:hypothetical protein